MRIMESEILLKLSKGDKSAFKLIFDTYYKSLSLFIQKIILNAEQSEDIAQEVFIKIWEKRILFSNTLALKAYLYQAAKNKALNVIEHEAVKKRYQDRILYVEKTENFFFQHFIEQETNRLIMHTVDKLPPRAKEVLYLNLEGHKNQEIADHLQISINTVKTHKASAYKFLKENLKDISLLIIAFFIHFNN